MVILLNRKLRDGKALILLMFNSFNTAHINVTNVKFVKSVGKLSSITDAPTDAVRMLANEESLIQNARKTSPTCRREHQISKEKLHLIVREEPLRKPVSRW